MKKQVLFIHGAGAGAYKADVLLANNLQTELGKEFEVISPEMPDEDNAPYEIWKGVIEKMLREMQNPVILAGHSIGASHLVKILTEIKIPKSITGVFLLNAPFWGGDGWKYEGYKELELPENAASKIPKYIIVTFYHSLDDEIVPFKHMALYNKVLQNALYRKVEKGGHQMNNDLSQVAKDIDK